MFSDHVPLTEHVVVPDVFVSGLARIEEVGGGNLRFTFFTVQRSTMFSDERYEHVVIARIVMPSLAVMDAAKAALVAVSGVQGVIGDVVVDKLTH